MGGELLLPPPTGGGTGGEGQDDGTTLIGLFRGMWKPVEKGGKVAAEGYETARRKAEERHEQKRFNPDVNLG